MSSLLRIDASPRGNKSYSRRVGDAFTESWTATHPNGTVVTRDLATHQPTFVDLQWIAGAYTQPDQHTEEHKAALKLSDELIAEVKAADHILLTMPFYNFNVPAVVKAWIDHLVRAGKTFAVSNGSYSGLLDGNKKVTIVIAAGGKYQGTPGEQMDAATPYLKSIFGFMGLKSVSFVDAGGVSVYSHQNKTEEQFLAPLREQAAALGAA